MSHDPFRIAGPALVSFSGGRTSGYMLWRIVQAHGGALPDDVKVTFANTGKEMPQTLDFVRDCGERWGVEIVWLERLPSLFGDRLRRVDHKSAARNGEPFAALIAERKFLPNPVTRFCTSELKIRVMRDYARSLGWDEWDNIVGLRADERHRVARATAQTRERWTTVCPLAEAGVTVRDVADFWAAQEWGLALPTPNGRTPNGNCDLCFLKPLATITGVMRDDPSRADWWIEQEEKTGGRFRKDWPTYDALRDMALAQGNLPFAGESLTDCYCTGDA